MVGEIQLVICDGTSRGNWMAVSTTLGGQAQPVSGKPVTQFASRMRPLRSITASSARRSF